MAIGFEPGPSPGLLEATLKRDEMKNFQFAGAIVKSNIFYGKKNSDLLLIWAQTLTGDEISGLKRKCSLKSQFTSPTCPIVCFLG